MPSTAAKFASHIQSQTSTNASLLAGPTAAQNPGFQLIGGGSEGQVLTVTGATQLGWTTPQSGSTSMGTQWIHNGAPVIEVLNPANAINYTLFGGAAAGSWPGLWAVGAETNIGFVLTGKGTGPIRINARVFDFPGTGAHYWQNGEKIAKIGGRLFVGDSYKDLGAYPQAVENRDWMSVIAHQKVGYDWGARALAKFVIQQTNSQQAVAIHAASQSKNFETGTGYTAGTACIGIQSFVFNNAVGANHEHHAWCFYGEAHRENNWVGHATCIEIGVVENGSPQSVMHPWTQGKSDVLRLTSGVGHTAPLYDACAALAIMKNPGSFKTGIVFESGVVAKTGFVRPCIVMSAEDSIVWYTSPNNLGPLIKSECVGDNTGQRIVLSNHQFTIQHFSGAFGMYFNTERNGLAIGVGATSNAGRADGEIWFDGSHFWGQVGGVAKQLDNA